MTLGDGARVKAGPEAVDVDRRRCTEADALFAAIDRRAFGDGLDCWVASVLGIHGDDRDWWIDVATAADPSVGVIVRLSRHATTAHAVAALQGWRPTKTLPRDIIKIMCVC